MINFAADGTIYGGWEFLYMWWYYVIIMNVIEDGYFPGQDVSLA